jgi:hypothetical protein
VNDVVAGRETDVLVAEKIMKLTVKPITVIGPGGARADFGTVGAPRTMQDGRTGVAAEAIPHYSTDIAAAWMVFEWIRDLLGPEVTVVVGYSHETEQYFCQDNDAQLGVDAGAETAPLAICRAALKAHAKFAAEGKR